jgi:hypothetical protein
MVVVCGLTLVLAGAVAPVAGRAQEATPVAAGPGSLAAMLRLAPDVVSGALQPPTQIATYADLAAQTAVAGLPLPTSTDDPNFEPWTFALSALIVPEKLLLNATRADWHELLGFDLWQIDQSLQIGEPPVVLTFLRGRFEEAAIRAAWSSQGYRMLDVDGVAVASLHEDASFDLTTDLGRYAFGQFNNAAILPDGTLVYAATLDGMRGIIAVAHGGAPSLADRPDVAPLVGAIAQPLASALLVSGTALQWQQVLGADATAAQIDMIKSHVAPMPPILMALFGVTAGGPLVGGADAARTAQSELPPARYEIAILLASRDEAAAAAQGAKDRLANLNDPRTHESMSDEFASWDVHALADRPIVAMELTFAPGVQPRLWLVLFYAGGLGFLAW